MKKLFYDNDYTLLDKDKNIVSETIWSITLAGGSLLENKPLNESEIILESDLIKQGIKEKDLAIHLVVYDVSQGESFVPCNSLTREQQEIIADEYEITY